MLNRIEPQILVELDLRLRSEMEKYIGNRNTPETRMRLGAQIREIFHDFAMFYDVPELATYFVDCNYETSLSMLQSRIQELTENLDDLRTEEVLELERAIWEEGLVISLKKQIPPSHCVVDFLEG